ncbi:PEP-CTERM sorting domain-containing protein [uncultured Pseudodesulfovibrio sp.]|uniref:PEP-CTERM sorting domain-containing protein n=1 Tax=uncultured Pseudodesulfovibrio sp. TaxID=2035858 RepID=UPI0029C75359|nr:PEP-CTERM sorting domain-containing protein [uncultured Pseudodesulfovibrio sp.]
MKRYILALLIIVGMIIATRPERAEALVLPDLTTSVDTGLARQYGDFYSYSLPILNYVASGFTDTVFNSGDPYYLDSAPGQLADNIVIMTGTTADAANTTGFENAYDIPNSYSPYSTVTYADPTVNNGIYADSDTSWDANISALVAYLDGSMPVFYFNNNETGSAQDLYITATLSIWNSTTSTVYGTYHLIDPLTSDNYVLSGGDVEFDGEVFSHNLGAKKAAYAVLIPELNAFLDNWTGTGDSQYDMLSLEISMYNLDSGYEQAFIGRGEFASSTVPEPATWLLLGLGLLGLPLARRMRRR